MSRRKTSRLFDEVRLGVPCSADLALAEASVPGRCEAEAPRPEERFVPVECASTDVRADGYAEQHVGDLVRVRLLPRGEKRLVAVLPDEAVVVGYTG